MLTMCCLYSSVCQHHQQCRKFGHHKGHHSAVTKLCLYLGVLLLNLSWMSIADGYNTTELRKQELHNIAIRLDHSIDADKYACDSYFDYVCGRGRPLFSIMGNQPDISEIIQLLTALQEDSEQFEAKQKVMDFFISCNTQKSLEDCYRETFEHFKPLFGYLISKSYLDASSPELITFLQILNEFAKKSGQTGNFSRNTIRLKLAALKDKFQLPQMYFRSGDLNYEYETLKIYRESYQHNVRNLELFKRRNSTYDMGVHKTMLDWTLYLYQSRSKPRSYYYPTLNAHLWMSLYNTSERYYEPKRFTEIAECLKLPQFVNVLEEARILAIVYLKSFNKAWEDYQEWLKIDENKEIYNKENDILRQYQLNNEKIFFTLYGQNFCEFGKELAESVFYLGLKQSREFFTTYSCSYQDVRPTECF